jgi:putative colanic acid biosysnthesis UDP-glucose lipid carrier transferase
VYQFKSIASVSAPPAFQHGDFASTPRQAAESRGKRALDIVVAATGIVALLPLFLLVALAIRLESRGPVFFRQRRGGFQGRPFQILKFRTMSVLQDDDDVRHAKRGDCRITRVGYFLRRSSIDELPQLFNVLRGEMSLIGPRPHALAHDRYYRAHVANYDERFLARPGITGLAQVSGHRGDVADVDAMSARVAADIAYVNSWSARLDWKILALTVVCVLLDDRAV